MISPTSFTSAPPPFVAPILEPEYSEITNSLDQRIEEFSSTLDDESKKRMGSALLQRKREILVEIERMKLFGSPFVEIQAKVNNMLGSLREIGVEARQRDSVFQQKQSQGKADLMQAMGLLQPSSRAKTLFSFAPKTETSKASLKSSSSSLKESIMPIAQFLHDAAILTAHDLPLGADPLGEDFVREYSVLLAHNPKAYEEAKERMDACKQATPSLEETVEKIACLGPLLMTPMVLGAAYGGTISCLGLFFLKKMSVKLASGIPTALVAAAAMKEIGKSVFDEASLKKEAALSKGSETVLYILPKHDSNAASHVSPGHEAVRKLAKGKKLVIQRVSSPEELSRLIAEHKNISHLWLNLRGAPDSLVFDRDDTRSWNSTFSDSWPLDRFAPEAQIILHSCSTGIILAGKLYQRLEGTVSVVAPATDISSQDTQVSEGSVSFVVSGEDVTVRYPASHEPVEHDSQKSVLSTDYESDQW